MDPETVVAPLLSTDYCLLSTPMKCLSLIQPYATLVLAGAKRYETRSWTVRYRGPLAIHASKTVPLGIQDICEREPFRSALRAAGYDSIVSMPRGVVLGTVELVDVIPTKDMDLRTLTPEEHAFGDYRPGRFAWQLANPKLLPQPQPFTGNVGLFDVTLNP